MRYLGSMFRITLILLILWQLPSCGTDRPTDEAISTETTQSTTEAAAEAEAETADGEKTIIFFGNSLTAGYQLEEAQSFPSLIQDVIDSLDMEYRVVNAGLSGETTSGGLNRVDWVLRQGVDIFVLELGGNDVLRGFELTDTRTNLAGILDKVQASYPEAQLVVAGMQAPPNMGDEYTTEFANIYPALAQEYNAALIPFLLDGVAAIPELNLPDGIHPNVEGQRIVRDNVWRVLQPLL